MRTRDRKDDDIERRHRNAPSEGADGGGHAGLRAEAHRFLTIGDEAITRALSGDSEGFLRANRQQGGQ